MKPEIILNIKSELGECPLWHPLEKKLYWVDISGKVIYCYDPKDETIREAYRGELIGGYTIQSDGSLLLFMEKGAIKLWRNNKIVTLIKEVTALKDTRFNDVIADPAGRVFCGTMPDKKGEAYLYRLDTDGKLTLVLDGVGLSNGMGFNSDKKKMYFTDSKKGEIFVFDYNIKDGSLSKKKLFLKINEEGIEPDGLTVDAEGYVWIACWNGGCIKRFTSEGREDLKVFLPAKKTTCLTFGGEDYQDIYVTSASCDDVQNDLGQAGALFRIKSGIQGLPEHQSMICV